MSAVRSGYVRADDGTYLVQVVDPSSRWGFYLASADSSDDESPSTWDGGFGALGNGAEWEVVPTEQVPADVQDRLGWLLEVA